MVAVDPLASIRIQDIYVTVGGVEYEMVGRCAADWLTVLAADDLVSVLPGWLDQRSESLILDQLALGTITPQELDDATKDVLTAAAGRDWWWAMSLYAYAVGDVHHWSRVNGRLVLAGIDVEKISLSAWVDAVYAVHTEGISDNDEYTKFKIQIDTPPDPSLINEEEEAAAFMSMLG